MMTVVATCQSCGVEIQESKLGKLRLLIISHEKSCTEGGDLRIVCSCGEPIRAMDGAPLFPTCGCLLWTGVIYSPDSHAGKRPWVILWGGDVLRKSNNVGRSFKSQEAASGVFRELGFYNEVKKMAR